MISEIGGYLATDAEGYLIPDGSWDKIQPHWQALVKKIIHFTEQQQDENLLSLYLRGSVPRGLAVDYVSDLDLVFLAKEKVENQPEPIKQFKKELLEQFPFCKGIEWPVYGMDELAQKWPPLAVMIKTQCLFLWGQDVTRDMPKHKPGREMMSQVFWLEKDWATYQAKLDAEETQAGIDARCLWMGKILLRSVFELSTLQTPRFTRDLYWCYAGAADIFPEMKDTLYAVLELALQKNIPREKILPIFTPVADFAIGRIKQMASPGE